MKNCILILCNLKYQIIAYTLFLNNYSNLSNVYTFIRQNLTITNILDKAGKFM